MKKKVFKIVGNVIFYVVIGLLAILIGFSIYAKKSNKQIFEYATLWVLTDSMETAIPAQSYVLVKKVDAKNVNEGDIICFISKDPSIYGELNTHRVVEVIGDHEQFKTKGDHNVADDKLLTNAEDVVYRFVCKLTVLTFFGRLFSSIFGLVISMTLIVACCVIALVVYNYKNNKKTKQEQLEDIKKKEIERLEEEDKKNSNN